MTELNETESLMSSDEDVLYTNDDTEEPNIEQGKEINSDQKDEEICSLYRKCQKGRLNTQPDYQRHYVWDNKKASRLIESIFLNIPIPMIYMAESNDTINVIDGQQRLTAIFNYLDGKFALTGLVAFPQFNKLKYQDLPPEFQNKLDEYSIRTITFKNNTAPNLQFEIFSRLNTGAVALNDQELRNCVYRGPFNDLIKELAKNEKFLKILGLKEQHKRMQDIELVLRFFGFYIKTYLNYKAPMKSFLNETISSQNSVIATDKHKIEEYTKIFNQTVNNVYSLLGENCFRRYVKNKNDNTGSWDSKRFNVSLYDILMWSMSRIDQNMLMRHKDAIREAYIELMVSNDDFVKSIQMSTSDPEFVKRRFRIWEQTLDEIVGDDKVEPRAFSLELKQKLFDANPTCEICGQRITHIDDAAIDHVEQYWMGGRTTEENARLAHRYCNNARARKEAQEKSQSE